MGILGISGINQQSGILQKLLATPDKSSRVAAGHYRKLPRGWLAVPADLRVEGLYGLVLV